ncbi:MAG: histidine kinase [Clostridia bacterium]|nr:histidine kinase [Clostridia bacterium]
MYKVNRVLNIVVIAITAIIVLLTLCLLDMTVSEDVAKQPKFTSLSTPEIIGEYSVNGSEYVEFTGYDDMNFDIGPEKTALHFRFHLTEDIPVNVCIMYRVYHQYVSIAVNGTVINEYDFASGNSMYNTSGMAFVCFPSPGITTDDVVTVYTYNTADTVDTVFTDFLQSVRYGYSLLFYWEYYREGFHSLLLCILLIALSVVLIFYYLFNRKRKLSVIPEYLVLGLILFFSGLFVFSQLPTVPMLVGYPTLFMVLRILSLMFLSYSLLVYFFLTMRSVINVVMRVETILALISGAVLILLQIFGVLDLYSALPIISLAVCIFAATGILGITFDFIVHNSKRSFWLLLSASILGGALTAEGINYFAELFPSGIVLMCAITIFVIVRVIFLSISMNKTAAELRDTEKIQKELAQSRIAVMLSQIRPHFIFNTLNAIADLITEDPLKAEDAVISFSNYLRVKIDSLQDDRPVLFSDELKHIEYYVDIEKLRFENRIRFVEDVKFTDFSLPSLSLQPLVENSIKHGLLPKPEGGTITLSTRKVKNKVLITIEDDGVGFNTKNLRKIQTDSYASLLSVGLSNVESRLKYLAQAEMKIVSEPGEGTTISILIPLPDKKPGLVINSATDTTDIGDDN